MNDGRHVIWSNDLDYDDWKDDLEEQYPELSENERVTLMYEINGDYLWTGRGKLSLRQKIKSRSGIRIFLCMWKVYEPYTAAL